MGIFHLTTTLPPYHQLNVERLKVGFTDEICDCKNVDCVWAPQPAMAGWCSRPAGLVSEPGGRRGGAAAPKIIWKTEEKAKLLDCVHSIWERVRNSPSHEPLQTFLQWLQHNSSACNCMCVYAVFHIGLVYSIVIDMVPLFAVCGHHIIMLLVFNTCEFILGFQLRIHQHYSFCFYTTQMSKKHC